MQNLLVIFNPQAGSGRSKTYLPLIESYLQGHDIEYQIKHTERSGHAQAMVESTDLSPFDGVVAAGGDGTLFEVINGLMSHKERQSISFGVIPVGTGNAFSRELGLLPTDWKKGIDVICKQQTKPIDVGYIQTAKEHFYFLNIVGMGFVVDAGKTTLKIKQLGQSAYTLATLWETIKLKAHPVKIDLIDEHDQTESIDEALVFVEVANSRYTGTSFLIAPDAKIDDGLLDVIILKKISRIKILSLFPTIYSGKHINYKEVECRKVKSITIRTTNPMALMPDGEFKGQTPVTITVVHQALTLFF
ncbi:diacylglycerol/lipid kinase family protein [Marinicella litoralis]|uniref:YegS/Rv2252/BmrU family lipid kinase n=1 Tax=Marinicella litoralis TaxID=644220 RepID=A0A4R6XYJ0_9GAMM|nr:diacylglycerol kinase family protein [Marinicella litoralis]TDR22813.1 YegS/Rv2252/BmrU family lipid kinase [Marinicella litoralis]